MLRLKHFFNDFNLTLPEDCIRAVLLRKLPLGTKKSVVIDYMDEKNLEISHSFDFGYFEISNSDIVIGNSHFEVYLGEYRLFWERDIQADFIFDENEEMIEIIIHKFIDAP